MVPQVGCIIWTPSQRHVGMSGCQSKTISGQEAGVRGGIGCVTSSENIYYWFKFMKQGILRYLEHAVLFYMTNYCIVLLRKTLCKEDFHV